LLRLWALLFFFYVELRSIYLEGVPAQKVHHRLRLLLPNSHFDVRVWVALVGHLEAGVLVFLLYSVCVHFGSEALDVLIRIKFYN
jgi:hypothetical protein